MVKRVLIITLSACVLLSVLMFSVGAEEDETLACDDEYRKMLEAIPSDIADLLPQKLFSVKTEDIVAGATEMTSFSYVINIALEYLGLELKSAVKLLATLIGILMLAAVLNAVKSSFSSPAVSEAFSICASVAVFLTAIVAQFNIISSVSEFFSRLTTLANSMIPLLGALYAMGGNVTGAVVGHSSMVIFMTLLENLCAGTALPVAGICIAFSAVGALAPTMGIGGISAFFRKTYTGILTFTMTVFTTVMAAQSLLASKTDSIAGKAAKFAVGNMVPLVGSAIAGTLGTVAASVEYIRAGVGVMGIVIIILLLLPTLLTLLVTKYAFSLASGAADILGCSAEGRLINELSGINGFLLASACICSVTLIFLLTFLAKCSSAVA